MREMVEIYQDEVQGIKDAPGIVPSFVFQLITTDMTKHFSKNGGNPLGLANQGPLNGEHTKSNSPPCLCCVLTLHPSDQHRHFME